MSPTLGAKNKQGSKTKLTIENSDIFTSQLR
jgi:hypothetical protein